MDSIAHTATAAFVIPAFDEDHFGRLSLYTFSTRVELSAL